MTPDSCRTQGSGEWIGVKAGTGVTILCPSCCAQPSPSPVVPQPGYDWPPQAMMMVRARIWRPGNSSRKPSACRSILSTGASEQIWQALRRSKRTKASRTSIARSETGKILPVSSTFVGTPSRSISSIKSWGGRAAKAERRN